MDEVAGQTAGRIAVVGPDAALRARLGTVLSRAPMVTEVLGVADFDDIDPSAPRPVVALLDASELDDERAVASLARLDLLWPCCRVVVLAREVGAGLVRGVLDAGALSVLDTTAAEEELRCVVEAALRGRGLLDVDIVRPVIDVYARLLNERSRRDRAVIESLAAAVEAKDRVTSRHLRQVSHLAMQLAEQLDPRLSRTEDFLYGCLLHDVGKIGVPEGILGKPGPLTDDEWVVMRRHPQTGARVVRPLGLSSVVVDIVLHHHERWDGRGYPDGLREDEIPFVARIFSVCDALEAMMARRPYREPVPAMVAFERVRMEAGQQFDPLVVDALARGVSSGTIDLEDAGDGSLERPPGNRFDRTRLVGLQP